MENPTAKVGTQGVYEFNLYNGNSKDEYV